MENYGYDDRIGMTQKCGDLSNFRSFLTESESEVRLSSVLTWQSIINFVGKPVPEESTEPSPPVKR